MKRRGTNLNVTQIKSPFELKNFAESFPKFNFCGLTVGFKEVNDTLRK